MNRLPSRYIHNIKQFGAGKNAHKLTVVILGGSIGYRMKSYGAKSLVKLTSGKNILETQLQTLSSVYNNYEVILTTGYEADKVIKNLPDPKLIRIVENQKYEETNVLEEIRLALNNCITADNILFIYGDVVFNTVAIEDITKDGNSSTIIHKGRGPDDEKIGITLVNEKVTSFGYGINPEWGYITYLTGRELDVFKKIAQDRDKNKLYMFEALNLMLDKNCQLKAHQPDKLMINRIEYAKDII